MATLILSAAGAGLGGAIGGSVLGIGAAALGQAAGAVAGGLVDARLIGAGKTVATGRARSLRIQGAAEGTPLPRIWGRMRVAPTLIWSTRFLERVRESGAGGKGGGTTLRAFSYSISFAVTLGEGPIDHVGRIWADGKPLCRTEATIRVYTGTDDQLPDPKIEAVEGAGRVPAYRGTAYLVFEDLELERFGNRIPQITAEVFRQVRDRPAGPEHAPPLSEMVAAVALSPGTGEFALEPEVTRYVFEGGGSVPANVNTDRCRTDVLVGLDQLEAELPKARQVSLVVSWFGDDLRAGLCRVEPRVEEAGRIAEPEAWSVTGLDSTTARVVGSDAGGRPVYGGTPSDGSVIRAIREMADRGLKVMLYPFLLMDVPPDNALADPWTGATGQPPYPWRGRITLSAAPGQPGSPDQTAAAAAEVDAFMGTVTAADFTVSDGAVAYTGPQEWTWSRFALHLAALGAAAGGVESIVIGTELRGLTQIRSARTAYPMVERLRMLAAEVRALLPEAKISYAADWSEYFGHQPGDGSGDRIFHLDPLWADPQIDFVGIDDYLPLSDWRHEGPNADRDAGAASVWSLPYLESNVEGGEHYDFFYAGPAERAAQTRSPIVDTAHGEDWVFRPKDIRNWWANPHHDRVGGVRSATPTAWIPQSKPVWLTETGCPAVDLGANQPNLFFDPKSSESAFPHFSVGARDDTMQRRYLQAKIGYWSDPAHNPVSPVYGGAMIPAGRIYAWTWDLRPFPDFPMRESVWSDGPNYELGHWLTGRASAADLADLMHAITARAGVGAIDVARVYATVPGFLLEDTDTARAALQPLMLAFGVDAFEAGGLIGFLTRGVAVAEALDPARLVASDEPLGALIRERASAAELPEAVRLSHLDAEADYRLAAAEARLPGGDLARVAESSVPIALPRSRGRAIAERWLAELAVTRDRARFALPPETLRLVPADVVSLPGPGGTETYRIERITEADSRMVEAVRIEPGVYRPAAVPAAGGAGGVETPLTPLPGPLTALILDLPLADGTDDHTGHVAVAADPWPGAVSVARSASDSGYAEIAAIRKPALIGALAEALPPGSAALWQRVSVEVRLPAGALASADRLAVLNGANALAVEAAPGAWEILQAREAVLTGPGRYRLTSLLRGRRGTEHLAAQPIPAGARLVVLDDAVTELAMPADLRGLPRHYRIAPAGRALTGPEAVHLVETVAGVGLRPFAPAHLGARRLGDGAVALSWIRRTRIAGDSWEGIDVPLGEAREAYRVRVLAGGTVLRTTETAAPAFSYTAADQAADGAGGALAFRVAQISDAWGVGPETEVTLDG